MRRGMMVALGAMVLAGGGVQAQDRPADLARLLAGSYDNPAQWEDGGRSRPGQGAGHLRMNARVVPLPDGALVDGTALYIQQIQDNFAPHVYRQAVLVLRQAGGSVLMEQLRLREPDRWLDADAATLATLGERDLLPAEPGCDLAWRRTGAAWVGEMAPGTCRVEATWLGTTLTRHERWTVDPSNLTHLDRTTKADGTVFEQTPTGTPYRLARLSGG
ncbi:hypothetical protein HHL28_10420 [Aerophototrophica crusticola]|uniref:Uncharacterized protein n=1 Tax=Aerophototrophica crusticola TaxID=1709002 RepID=A0A858R7S9_9PROT|nr:hypothetical protein HHL28_10420 [Rhodospirillaceae bacterium B3]